MLSIEKGCENNMSSTIKFLQFLASPYAKTANFGLDKLEIENLIHKAEKNKMLFFFLTNLIERGINTFSRKYCIEKEKLSKINNLIAKISQILSNTHINYAFFKTIRPYKSTTVDLDILIFSDDGYKKSLAVLQKAGYRLLADGPQSATFYDEKANIGIDFYKEIAVSHIIYMDKQTLIPHVTEVKISNYDNVKVLQPEADLACIIAHSILKEQMYTLSEYFSFIYYLKVLNLQKFLVLIKQNNILNATRTHATITALLHKTAHGSVPDKLQELLSYLGEDKFESNRIIRKNFNTPHKYHPLTVAKSLLEVTKGRKAKQSLAVQLFYILKLNPKISKDFVSRLINHITRETY